MLQSKLCLEEDFHTEWYKKWVEEIKEAKRMHRKQWEFVCILKALFEKDMLQPSKRGLGFAVGTEPIPAVLAKHGAEVMATDIGAYTAKGRLWTLGNQNLKSISQLNDRNICPKIQFGELVKYRAVDMNDIPADLQDYDFNWSSCAIEHLGSIDHTVKFLLNQFNTLKKGGWAIHTTEFNVSSDTDTIEEENLVLFRKRDILRIIEEVRSAGHVIEDVDFTIHKTPLDYFIDLPPYGDNPHLKLMINNYVTTSILLIMQK